MKGLLSIADFPPGNLISAVGNHFVYVHVALRSRAGLPDNQRELIVQLPLQYFITHLRNQVPFFLRQHPQLAIGVRSTFFQVRKSINNIQRHGSRRSYFKIVERTCGLRTPEFISRNFYLPHRIFLNSVFYFGFFRIHPFSDFLYLTFVPVTATAKSSNRRYIVPHSPSQ
ncbi:hypothetical protein SDC9_80296 [bioreactor metagenome]|uniref:Uncharacterized protein n=1 Tax=bioreactor metagenome TaxID=1076179 RepID=A0A644Z0A0_9ZZZZ